MTSNNNNKSHHHTKPKYAHNAKETRQTAYCRYLERIGLRQKFPYKTYVPAGTILSSIDLHSENKSRDKNEKEIESKKRE